MPVGDVIKWFDSRLIRRIFLNNNNRIMNGCQSLNKSEI